MVTMEINYHMDNNNQMELPPVVTLRLEINYRYKLDFAETDCYFYSQNHGQKKGYLASLSSFSRIYGKIRSPVYRSMMKIALVGQVLAASSIVSKSSARF